MPVISTLWEAEAVGLPQTEDQPQLPSKFKANLGEIVSQYPPPLKKKKEKRK